jgi:hypothetical protein
MSVQPLETVGVETLEHHEVDALSSAATWYFKYHGRMIAERADDRSAAALAERDCYYDLHEALWKLGIRLALPDGLPPRR